MDTNQIIQTVTTIGIAFGVQIMSPHFETQPDGDVLVPKSEWYTPLASSNFSPGRAAGSDEASSKGPSRGPNS